MCLCLSVCLSLYPVTLSDDVGPESAPPPSQSICITTSLYQGLHTIVARVRRVMSLVASQVVNRAAQERSCLSSLTFCRIPTYECRWWPVQWYATDTIAVLWPHHRTLFAAKGAFVFGRC